MDFVDRTPGRIRRYPKCKTRCPVGGWRCYTIAFWHLLLAWQRYRVDRNFLPLHPRMPLGTHKDT